MAEEIVGKAQIAAEFDNSGAKRGMGELAETAEQMAERLRRAGEQGNQGLQLPGDGAKKSAVVVDKATKSIAASIERAIAEQTCNSLL